MSWRVFPTLKRERRFHRTSSLTLQALMVFLFGASFARADLDAETKKPYQVQIVLHVGANRVFTPLFQEQLERDVVNQLKLRFGALAKIEIVRAHPWLADIEKRGLDPALESQDALSGRTTHFVFVDHVSGVYQIHTRFHEGLVGHAGPPAMRTKVHDRAEVAETIARLVETAFSPIGTVTVKGKDVSVTLKGGELGVPLDRWIKKGHVFTVTRIVEESGRGKANRLQWAILEALDAPTAGVCRCRYWRRYQEDDLSPTAATLGHRAMHLATAPGPVKVRLLDDATLAPLEKIHVRVQAPGAGKPADLITDAGGLAVSREAFAHLAIVQVLEGGAVRAQFPVALIPGRIAVARVKIKTDGESLAPLATRHDAWVRRVYENAHVSRERSRALSHQLHQSLEAALAAGKKSLPLLQAEIDYLEDERVQLARLAKEKKWAFESRDADHEIAELKKQARELQDFNARIDGVLTKADGEKGTGLIQLLERARLHEAEAEFDHAIRLMEQVVQASPGEKKVQAHLEKLKTAWAPRGDKHAEARAFLLQTWPTLDVAGLGKNMEHATEALATCKAAGDKLTPVKLLRVNAGHTANLKKQLDTLKRRDTEDNRNQAKTLAQTGEALLRLHQDAAAWVGAK